VLLFILARATAYSTLFIGVLLILMPGRILAWSGVTRPATFGPLEVAGAGLTGLAAALAVWCIGTFVVVGKGTPAPFDPPRRLVVRGPYRLVRNPMYLGAGLAIWGAALVYRSVALFSYGAGFLLVMHALVVGYEEPTLERAFGEDYAAYRVRVPRWLPHF
jgi:protein-S-isoprenylcysteine O-methyltransferase Ste14